MKPYAPKLSTSPFFYKWIFPVFWLGMLCFIFVPVVFSAKGDFPLPVLLMPVLIGGIGFFFFKTLFWVLADEVHDEGDHLRVRKGGLEERIPLRNMLNVAMSRMANPQHISIRLRTPCSLGDEIVFLPKSNYKINNFSWPLEIFPRNPIAEDLMLRVDAARRQV